MVDRVNLGLLPDCEKAWESAIKMLKPTGGMLHIHANIDGKRCVAWSKRLHKTLQQYCIENGKEQNRVRVVHLEKVKSVAPNTVHVVADVLVYNFASVMYCELPSTKQQFQKIVERGVPVVFTNAFKWNIDDLIQVAGDSEVAKYNTTLWLIKSISRLACITPWKKPRAN